MKITHNTAILVLLLCLVSCRHNRKQGVREAVKVATICVSDSGYMSDALEYPGTIVAAKETPMSFQVAGTIKFIGVKIGDKVTKGQVIASLDASSLRNAYDIALAAENQAEDAYRRMKILHDQKALAEIKWVEIQNTLKQARAATAIARKALADATITAPYSGVVSAKLVDIGQTVAPFEPVVNIMTSSEKEVTISVTSHNINSISVGDSCTVRCGEGTYAAKVCEKGVSANPLTRGYTVKLTLDRTSDTDNLQPGMICSAAIYPARTEQPKPVILPLGAVLLGDDNRSFVWLCRGGTARRRFIDTGAMTDDGVIIAKGLSQGDSVIVSGQQKVSEGMKVTSVN